MKEKAQKAIQIIGKHSSGIGVIRLSNSLQYAEVDVDACIPLLNELYGADVSSEDIANAITIKDFLWLWDLNICQHLDSDVIAYRHSDNTTSANEIHQQKKVAHDKENSSEIKLNWFQKFALVMFAVYVCLLFVNKCTSFHNQTTHQAEGIMYYVTQVLGVIDTILSPLEWIPSGLQSALGYETYLNVICSLILGICSVVTIGLLSFDDEKDDKYIHQPFIGLLVTILAIAGGLYGPLDFNLWWTALMPLTFLGSTLFGVLIVKSTFKWLNPQKKAIRLLLQFFPLFLWLLLLQVIIR